MTARMFDQIGLNEEDFSGPLGLALSPKLMGEPNALKVKRIIGEPEDEPRVFRKDSLLWHAICSYQTLRGQDLQIQLAIKLFNKDSKRNSKEQALIGDAISSSFSQELMGTTKHNHTDIYDESLCRKIEPVFTRVFDSPTNFFAGEGIMITDWQGNPALDQNLVKKRGKYLREVLNAPLNLSLLYLERLPFHYQKAKGIYQRAVQKGLDTEEGQKELLKSKGCEAFGNLKTFDINFYNSGLEHIAEHSDLSREEKDVFREYSLKLIEDHFGGSTEETKRTGDLDDITIISGQPWPHHLTPNFFFDHGQMGIGHRAFYYGGLFGNHSVYLALAKPAEAIDELLSEEILGVKMEELFTQHSMASPTIDFEDLAKRKFYAGAIAANAQYLMNYGQGGPNPLYVLEDQGRRKTRVLEDKFLTMERHVRMKEETVYVIKEHLKILSEREKDKNAKVLYDLIKGKSVEELLPKKNYVRQKGWLGGMFG